MDQVCQFRFRTRALLEQIRIRVSLRLMRVTAAFLAVEIHRRITTTTARWTVLVSGSVALVLNQCLDQHTVHTEMLLRKKTGILSLG
jgi:hypothetical protein